MISATYLPYIISGVNKPDNVYLMDIKTAKRWFNWHKWSSLICTLFLLMLCVTGLPLIFHEELDKILEKQVVADAHALIYSINLLNR